VSSSKQSKEQAETSGGQRLRQIREEAGRTQLWVELEAGLGTGYLQRLESGRVVQPASGTLGRILKALDASYNERRTVMRRFGYRTPTDPPDAGEIRWARELAAAQLNDFPFPAYALDCLHRLVTWNTAADGLLQLTQETTDDLRPMLEPWFDECSHLGRMVVDPDDFLPALVIAFRYEARRFREEVWSQELVGHMRAIPRFERYWRQTAAQGAALGAARALLPLRLDPTGEQMLSFRLSSEPFIDDDRFRVVYYFPDDPVTMARFARG
jgi:transcriptional regulator with XRE-family HTH domain